MTDLPTIVWWAALLAVPLLVVGVDCVAALLARLRGAPTDGGVPGVEDFEVVVPIWGSVRYLENVDFLAAYGDRVLLCTTTSESEHFDTALDQIAATHGFRVLRTDVVGGGAGKGRATSGTVRDALVRDAHRVLQARYVVCLDADTETTRPLQQLVGQVEAGGYDLVSVRLVPSNTGTWLGRLQAHEYRSAMRLRRIVPWLVSGACHAGLRTSHREVMARHSLFFQGNDVELGWLARGLGQRVGHVAFEVPTAVPVTVRSWWRQRIAWAGGEVRLFLANPQLVLRHPFLWIYGALVTIAGVPLRWWGLTSPGTALLATVAVYALVIAVMHRGHWDRWLLVLPVYTLVTSLVIVPVGLVTYIHMAVAHRNAGLIRTRRRPPVAATTPAPQVSTGTPAALVS